MLGHRHVSHARKDFITLPSLQLNVTLALLEDISQLKEGNRHHRAYHALLDIFRNSVLQIVQSAISENIRALLLQFAINV
jgi:hypothetical protein